MIELTERDEAACHATRAAGRAPPAFSVCVVIPAYNEAGRIGGVVRAVREYLPDVVVVDDCSTDGTGGEAREAGALVLRHPENRGKGAALKTGLDQAVRWGHDAAITMDGDGQHDPGDIPRFIARALQTGADIVIGTRMHDVRGMPFHRYCTNRITSGILSALTRRRLTDTQSGHRLIRTRIWPSLRITSSRYEAESEILLEASTRGTKIEEIEISTTYRDESSKIHPFLDTVRFIRLMLRYI